MVVDNTYSFPFVSHATLEPHNCTADFRNGEMWVRGPIQMPTSALALVARATGLPADKVHVDFTRIGGGFGRRLLYDYAAEAAVVAKAIERRGHGDRQPRRRSAARLLSPSGDAAPASRDRSRDGKIVGVGSHHRELFEERLSQGSARRRIRRKPTAATSAGCSRSSSSMRICSRRGSRMRGCATASADRRRHRRLARARSRGQRVHDRDDDRRAGGEGEAESGRSAAGDSRRDGGCAEERRTIRARTIRRGCGGAARSRRARRIR